MTLVNETRLPIGLSDSAMAYISDKVSKQPEAKGFRLSVKKAGCSGYMYVTDIVNEPVNGDLSFKTSAGWMLFVDKKSLSTLKGVQIDCMKQGLGLKQLIFINPNQKGQCGCGESFLM